MLLEDTHVDAVLLINVPPIMIDPVEVAATVTEVARKHNKPVLGCFMGIEDILRTIQDTKLAIIPLYPFPESAAKALNALVRYSQLRNKVHGEPEIFPVQTERVRNILTLAKSQNRKTLHPTEIHDLLEAYSIPAAPVAEAKTVEEAVSQSRKLGYPLVMKAMMQTKQHKSDFGGVALDLRSDSEVTTAFEAMNRRIRDLQLEEEWQGVYLQPMIRGGKEVILGKTDDPHSDPF